MDNQAATAEMVIEAARKKWPDAYAITVKQMFGWGRSAGKVALVNIDVWQDAACPVHSSDTARDLPALLAKLTAELEEDESNGTN